MRDLSTIPFNRAIARDEIAYAYVLRIFDFVGAKPTRSRPRALIFSRRGLSTCRDDFVRGTIACVRVSLNRILHFTLD